MAKCYLVKYLEWPVAATDKRTYLTVYLAQKKICNLANAGLTIEKITREEMYTCHSDIILDEHETGFVVSPLDVDAFNDRRGADEMAFESIIDDLKRVKERLNKGKDIKKIDKAIEVLKENSDKFKGKIHNIDIMDDIIALPFMDLVQEAEMLGLYRRSMDRDGILC